MKIPLKAKVICKDGEFGSIKELLIDPIKESVTHVVIDNKHNNLQVIIPLDIIDYTSDDVITIEKTADQLNKFPPFIIQEFISVPSSDSEFIYWGVDPAMSHSYTMFPYVIHDGKPVIEMRKEDMPIGEIKLKKGMCVKDNNGKKLGHIDELIVDADGEFISHIVMRTGHLFDKKEVSVPNIHISSFDHDCIRLSIHEDDVENLPEVIIKRSWK
ncbi:MAG: PRC-barrel domain-containing protein [Spirochaetaceae bacterium]